MEVSGAKKALKFSDLRSQMLRLVGGVDVERS